MGCDYGFKLDESTGCPLCECQDLCESSICTEGSHCEMTAVKCDDGALVCPPVPVCIPDVVVIDHVRFPPTCPVGNPYVVPILNATVECKVDEGVTYGCPGDHDCLVHPESDGRGICCPKPSESLLLGSLHPCDQPGLIVLNRKNIIRTRCAYSRCST